MKHVERDGAKRKQTHSSGTRQTQISCTSPCLAGLHEFLMHFIVSTLFVQEECKSRFLRGLRILSSIKSIKILTFIFFNMFVIKLYFILNLMIFIIYYRY
jgi:hypothetical protein